MSAQDEIDQIDPTKPVNMPVSKTDPRPTVASVRDNFLHIKNALQWILSDGGVSGIELPTLFLTGVSFVVSSTITAADNALVALGKLQAQINLKQDSLGYTAENAADKGAANGYCPLDAGIKIAAEYLPDAILGALKYQTSWDANTNSPAIPVASSANKGHYWIVGTAGTTDLSGITDWKVGDWLVSDGTTYGKIDNTDAISLFNGRTGNINLLDTDLSDVLNVLAAKTTLVGADMIPILDSNASNVLKKVTLDNVWAWVKAKADAIYQPTSAKLTDIAALAATAGYVMVGNGTTWILQTLGDSATKNVGTGPGNVAAGDKGLPDTGSDGNVLTVVSGAWASAASSGGGGGGTTDPTINIYKYQNF